MAIPYQESFGDDFYEDERPLTRGYREDDVPPDWYYGAPGEERRVKPLDTIGYNPVTRSWECTCKHFQVTGTCVHSYRFKKQVTVVPKEEYL